MGLIFRLPFYLVASMAWIFIGGAISVVQIVTLPLTIILSLLIPSIFGEKVTDALSLGTLRRGFKNLNRFLGYGL